MGRPVNPNVPEEGYVSKRQFDQTGTIVDEDFTIQNNSPNSKLLDFELAEQTANTKVTLATSPGNVGDIVVYLPSVSGTLLTAATDNPAFAIMQPITGTSPTALTPTDTLTFESSDSTIGVAGNSVTNKLNITATPASVSQPGIVTTGTQSFAGTKTFASIVMTGGAFTQSVTTLTDAATITTNVSLGNHFQVTLTANRTLGNPTNPTDGQKVVWEFIQDGTGGRTLAYASKFTFGNDIPNAILSNGASKRDFLLACYRSTTDKWYVIAYVRGY